MKCFTDEELTDILSGETTPGNELGTDGHLASCPNCASRLAALGRAAKAAAAATPAPVSADFTAKLMSRIREEEAAAPARTLAGIFSGLFSRDLVLAACTLTLFVAAFLRLSGPGVPSALKTAYLAQAPGVTKDLYLTDGPATPLRLAALTASNRPAPQTKPDGMYYSDYCRTANCGM